MSDKAKASVPRFASFKPAVKRPPSPEPHQPLPVKRRRTASPHESHHHSHTRRGHHSHRKDHKLESHDRIKGPARSEALESSAKPEAASASRSSSFMSDLYTIDTRGDPQNWTYQRLHKYSVPQYRRTGTGNVLGLASRIKIDRATSVEDKIYLVDTRRRATSHKERALLKKSKYHHELRLSVHQQGNTLDPSADFVFLRGARRATHVPSLSPEPNVFDQVRSLQHSVPQVTEPDDPDLVYASSNDELDSSALDVDARQRNIELARATKSDPASLQPWLDLIAHQQCLVRSGAPAAVSSDFTDTERRSLADLRLHIYEKASKSVPLQDKSARETLFHSMFREASVIWDVEKYLRKLESAIRELPGSLPLWTAYLSAAQSNSLDFRFEKGKNFFLQSLRSLRAAHFADQTSSTGEIEDMCLYILLRYTTYLRETGYEELSISTWQALFEFHLFRSDSVDGTGMAASLASFESFWDSEVPRFGEPDARGWKQYGSEPDTVYVGQFLTDEPVLKPARPFRSFVHAEQYVSALLRFPGRTAEESISDDPFHIVFFSDLKDVLEVIPFQFSPRALTDAFLCYMGLPAFPAAVEKLDHSRRVQQWQSDAFIGGGWLREMVSTNPSAKAHNPVLQHFQTSTQALFSHSFPSKVALVGTQKHDEPSLDVDALLRFLRRGLSALAQTNHGDEDLAEYYLAFECCYYPKEASKSARATLKRRPSSLRLYNACAMVESALGRTEKAARIWSGAIKMKDSFPLQSQQDSVILWQAWTWSDMQENQLSRALSRLVSFDGSLVDDIGASVTNFSAMLRVKRAFKEGFEHASTHRNAHLSASNVECLALLAYLSQPNPLVAAVDVVQEYCARFSHPINNPVAELILELLHQTKARILAFHIQQQRPYKPAFVRSELEASIKLFPSNTIFLWLYKENEARFRIDDRVRSVLRDEIAAGKRSPLVACSFEIDQEISRFSSQSSGSTVESVRATFTRALLANGSHVRHSKLLWTRWFCFEEYMTSSDAAEESGAKKRRDQQNAQKWKEVFLGGLHHLPWVKEWIMTGLESFESTQSFGWTTHELKRLYNVLHERELRVRVEGIEDLLDDIANGKYSSAG